MRPVLALVFCLAAICPVAWARPANERPINRNAAAKRTVRSAAKPVLRCAAAKRPMRRFLTSATQVTGLPSKYTIHACRRRSKRVVDCAVTSAGRPSAGLRAKLVGRSSGRIQLYVLATPPLA